MTQALLLMDLQDAVLTHAGTSADYLDRVVEVQQRAEDAGVLVILVRIGYAPGHPEISVRNKIFAGLKGSGGMLLGDPSAEPSARLLRDRGEVVVTKKRVSAFAGSELDVVLRGHDVSRLVLVGVNTSGVVLSTLREAADRDFEIAVLHDLCHDPDPEVHDVLVGKVFPSQAEVIAAAAWRP